jgi:hypothetical protein
MLTQSDAAKILSDTHVEKLPGVTHGTDLLPCAKP